MKNSIRLEEFAMFALALFAFSHLDYSWGLFALFILAPDLSALGYLISPYVGSFSYNLFHNKGLGILAYILGTQIDNQAFVFAGIIIFAHSSLDRFFGYGLKLPGKFDQTHLGPIGKAARETK